MGTQTGWQPDWGWGALDLEEAARDRTNFYTHEIAGGDAHFYRADVKGPGERATLVWNRRALGCIAPGCDTTALTLSNLDLEQLDPESGVVEARSASAIDNVEQVRSPAGGAVIYKVKAASTVDGLPGEPYALAARRQLTRLTSLVLARASRSRPLRSAPASRSRYSRSSRTRPRPQRRGRHRLAGPSPGRRAPSGPASHSLGTLARGETRTVTWTVRAQGDAVHRIGVRAAALTLRGDLRIGGRGHVRLRRIGSERHDRSARPARRAIGLYTSPGPAGRRRRAARLHRRGLSRRGPFTPWLTATPLTEATYEGPPRLPLPVPRSRHRSARHDVGSTRSQTRSVPCRRQHLVRWRRRSVRRQRVPAALSVRTIKRRGGRIEIAGTIGATASTRLVTRPPCEGRAAAGREEDREVPARGLVPLRPARAARGDRDRDAALPG